MPRVLARHIAREIEVRLRGVAEPEDQIALANSLLAALEQSDGDEVDDTARVERAERLHAIYRALPPARPMTPLGQSTLLTRSSKDPVLGHELKSEIASCDTVDVIAAFITMGGIRQLWPELEALSNRAGRVRVLTTVFTGSTEVRAVDALSRLPGCEVRISYDVERTRLHAKAWLFSRDRGGEDLHTAFPSDDTGLKPTMLDDSHWSCLAATMGSEPTAIDLFAGAGGLSTGLKTAGFSIRVAVELDPTSATSFKANHAGTAVLISDVRNTSGPTLLSTAGLKRGELSLLTGCPPCQGYSTLRTNRQRRFVSDPRNNLIFEFLRLVRSTQPKAVLLENVPGLATDRRFREFRIGLGKAGYRSDFKVLDAADFGVPQRRRRLVLIAMKGRPVPDDWHKPARPRAATVRQAIANLPRSGASGDPLHDLPENRSAIVLRRMMLTPADGGTRKSLEEGEQLECHKRTSGFNDVYGRMFWDAPAPTITSGCHNPSKGRFMHPEENRAITLREAALLQSFPRSYKFALSRGKEHAAGQIGNAFPPRLIVPIARRIIESLEGVA